jgi:hypothetical protein
MNAVEREQKLGACWSRLFVQIKCKSKPKTLKRRGTEEEEEIKGTGKSNNL